MITPTKKIVQIQIPIFKKLSDRIYELVEKEDKLNLSDATRVEVLNLYNACPELMPIKLLGQEEEQYVFLESFNNVYSHISSKIVLDGKDVVALNVYLSQELIVKVWSEEEKPTWEKYEAYFKLISKEVK